MAKVKSINGREILDSKGNPTLEVDLFLDDGSVGRASVPAGVSKGVFEVLELRDGDLQRYQGMGVKKAVSNVNDTIQLKLKGMKASQNEIDKTLIELDGTKEKRNLGANAILGVSLALARAMAQSNKMPLYQYIAWLAGEKEKKKGDLLPTPLLVLINGGAHAKNNLDFQEFLIIPIKQPFSEQIRIASEIFHILTKILLEKAYSLALGDEGGYGPNLPSNEEAVKILLEAIERTGYIPEKDVVLGLDVAATAFWRPPKYILANEKRTFDLKDFLEYYQRLLKLYPIKLLEDPLSEEDWTGWQKITSILGGKTLLVGDDIFVTNKERLRKGIELKIANALIIKPNQIGTLTETLETIRMAKEAGYKIVVSHRAGETLDSFIADLAFAIGAQYIKAGAPERGERIAKYNRLLEIEEEIERGA
jgi:enolase